MRKVLEEIAKKVILAIEATDLMKMIGKVMKAGNILGILLLEIEANTIQGRVEKLRNIQMSSVPYPVRNFETCF